MFLRSTIYHSALISTLLISVPLVSLAEGNNILSDSSFEQKLPADKGGWMLFDNGNLSQDQARNGKQSMYNWGFSRTVPSPPFLLGTVSGSFQEFPALPGSRWKLVGYGLTPNALRGVASYGIVQVSFFDDEGNDLGTMQTVDDKTPKAKTSEQINSQSSVNEWIFLDTGEATAPANTSKIHAFTLFVDYSGSDIAQGVYFDDLKLCSVGADSRQALTCN